MEKIADFLFVGEREVALSSFIRHREALRLNLRSDSSNEIF